MDKYIKADISKETNALSRIDNTLCLNNIRGNIEFNISKEDHIDCSNAIEMTNDIEILDEALNLLEILENKKPKVRELKKENTEYKKVLEVVFKKEINVKHFNEEIKILGKKFTYEFYLLEYDNYHYFVNEENKLTQEEFDLLKKWSEIFLNKRSENK